MLVFLNFLPALYQEGLLRIISDLMDDHQLSTRLINLVHHCTIENYNAILIGIALLR